MKKLISLVMVLSLVLCLATVALADEPAAGSLENPIVVTDIADLASVDVPMGEVKWYLLPAAWSGKILNFNAPMSGPAIYIMHPMFGYEMMASQGFMTASYTLEGWGDILIGLGSAFGYDITDGSCELVEPVEGSEAKPAVLTDVSAPVTVTGIESAYGDYEYFMTWTNNGDGGFLTLNGVTGTFNVVELNWTGYYSDSTEPVSVGVPAGETVKIAVRGMGTDPVTLDLSFEPFKEGESEYTPFEIADQDKEYTFEAVLKPNSEVFYKLNDVSGAILTIYDAHAYINSYGDCYVEWIDDGDDDVLTAKVNVYGDGSNVVIGIGSNSTTDVKYTVTVSEPLGYDENPIVLEKLDKIEAEIAGGLEDSLFYTWTATETAKVTLNITGAEWFGEALNYAAIYDEETWEVIGYEDVKPQVTVFVNGMEVIAGTEVVFDVEKGDKVIIKVQSLPIYDYESYGYSAYIDVEAVIDPLGSMNNPIVVVNPYDLGGIDVPAGQKVYVAISSMLNGQVLTVVGDANTVVYQGNAAVTGDNGIFTVALNGVPANMIVVENKGDKDASYIAEIAYPVGSMENPIVVNNPYDLNSINVAAGEKVYIVISSMLNGQVLNVVGDADTAVYQGTATVTGDNGFFTVALNGVPANMIVVENKGDKDASYIAEITYPVGSENNPIVIVNPSELSGIDVPAGEKVYVAISSMLNGQVVTIIGDANTAVYQGNAAVTGDNGTFTVTLNGVPTNMIVVENKGDKDASYIAGIAYPAGSESNPVVLNAMGGATNASAEAGSATYYVVNGSYNGNYIVVKGSGLTVTVNGKDVKAVGGKYYVKLDGTPVNSIVVANSGSAAVEYSISIATDNPATGDTGILVAMAAAIITLTGAVVLVANKKED